MAQEQEVLVMGIDLGTTKSCVGVCWNRRVEIVPNAQGNRITPSCVAFTGSERLLGEGANHQVATNASNTVFDVKRLMGRSFSDASVQSNAQYWPFRVIAGPEDKPLIPVSYRGGKMELSPEEISAMVLVQMKETAEAYVGAKITDAVISVPAYFNGSQRQATMDAAAIAGLNVMRLFNAPTAAAMAYGVNTKWRESTVLIYDLGGGMLDVSLVDVNKGGFKLQVKATAGDSNLGGEDFTNNMVDYFVNEFKMKNRKDISGDKKALGRLRRSCQDAKRRLSTNPRTRVDVDALFEGIDLHSEITRDQFEKLNEDLFRRCMEPIAKCLNDAGMDLSNVDDVVLVGGCTRIPRMQQLVRDFFKGKELCRNINVDEAVAHGATVQAATMHTGQIQNRQVRDITPFSWGIGIMEGIMLEVIRGNATIPTSYETTLVTVKEKQPSMEMTVYKDGRAMPTKLCIALDPNYKVRFKVDYDGILDVSVRAQDNKGWITITNLVSRLSLSEAEIKRMSQEAHEYKAQDEEHNKNVQARNDIQNLLFTISNNMKNLEDSAARLLLHRPKATRQQEEGTPLVKENKKMLQAQNDAIKNLQDRIKKLQETADETTYSLDNKELDTCLIINHKKKIDHEYQDILKQIDSVSQSKFNKPFPQK
ncbi:unnamed protein product [Alopecurus aequalis]